MNDNDLFESLNDLSNEQLGYLCKEIRGIQDYFECSSKPIWEWFDFILEGIRWECTDRICGTDYNQN